MSKTFYFVVKDYYNADQDVIYVINAAHEMEAKEKFMKYVCKLSIEFDSFTDFLASNQDIRISIINKMVNLG